MPKVDRESLTVAGIGVAGLAAVGLGGYLLLRLAKPVGDAAANAGQAAAAVTQGVENLAGATRDITKEVQDVFAPVQTPAPVYNQALPALALVVLNQQNINRNGNKTNIVQVRVQDGLGAKIPGAIVRAKPKFDNSIFFAAWKQDVRAIAASTWTTDQNGEVTLTLTVDDVPGIDYEDDFSLFASKTGYSSSSYVPIS